ncbi:MAG TPA: hypothetical protein VGJ31_12945 [Dongiaceae bacterium]
MAGLIALGASAAPPAAADDSQPPDHIVRGIRQGSEIEYLGEIVSGSAAELRKTLAQYPAAKVLHLNSPGGEIEEAHRMLELVRQRKLITTVDKICDSACTLVFLAGQQRVIAPGAEIGFHQPWALGISSAEMDTLDQNDKQYLRGQGVPQWFIDKAYSTPSSTIWIPTTTELSAANVITGVSNKYVIAVGNYRGSIGDQAYAVEVFLAAAKQRSPDRYEELHAKILQNLKFPSAVDDLSSDSFFMIFVLSFMAHAEDRPAIAYLQVFTRIVSRLATEDPELCYKILYPSRNSPGFDARTAIARNEMQQLGYATLRAATSGAQHNLSVPSAGEAAEPIAKIWNELRRQHPEDLVALSPAGSLSMSHHTVCQAQAHMYAQIGRLPEDEQGVVARFILASQSHQLGPADNEPESEASVAPTHLNIHPDK